LNSGDYNAKVPGHIGIIIFDATALTMGVYAVQIDIKAVQILNSRLFHDLVGATSAINTGLEFLQADAADRAALDLLGQSADRVSRRLDFFRAAFGAGGGREGRLRFEDVQALSEGWYADSKSKIVWPTVLPPLPDDQFSPPVAKVVMMTLMLADECLPRGGTVSVHLEPLAEGLGVVINAAGTGASAPEGLAAALADGCTPADLTVRNVAAFFAHSLAKTLNTRLETATAADSVQFASLFSRAGG